MTTLRASLQPALLGLAAMGMSAGARAAEQVKTPSPDVVQPRPVLMPPPPPPLSTLLGPTPADTVIRSARENAAMLLAQYLYSDELVVGDSKSDEKALEFANQMMAGSQEMVELEEDYPGIAKDLARAAMPITNASARQRLPTLWQREAAIFKSTYQPDEIEKLIAFYQSPTGRKLIREVTQNFTGEAMLAEARKSEDFKMTAASALADAKATVPAVVKAMNDKDIAVLMRLNETGLLTRMEKIAPQTHQILLDWYEETIPGEEEAIDKAMTKVIKARIGD